MKNRNFDPLDPLPADFLDALNEFISTLSAGFIVRIKPTDATVLQVVAGSGSDQVAIGIEGRWRYNATTIERASPGGSARTLDVFVTGTDNVFVPGDPGEIDNTDYAFALSIVEHNALPVGVAIKRLVATAVWSGTAFTALDVLAGAQSGTARHAATHATGASDPITPGAIGAEPAGTAAAEVAAHAALTTSAHGGIVASTDPRLTDARTPLAHAASHRAGGSDETSHAPLSARPILDVGVLNQIRAGRILGSGDFTTLMGLTVPVGLFSFTITSLANAGSGGALTNKGSVTFGPGIDSVAAGAAVFAGSTGQALYAADTGGSDPFRINTGSWGCWFRTAKRGTTQHLVSKWRTTGPQFGFTLELNTNAVIARVSTTGADTPSAAGVTDVSDDRWHHAVATYDGAMIRLYIDGVLDASFAQSGSIFGATAPFNVGAYGADGSTAATAPHFGSIDEVFVTANVLSADQVRLLYCTKINHGYAVTPKRAYLSVRRLRRGGPLVSGDFPSQPLRLYNFTEGAPLTDEGSEGVQLAINNAVLMVSGADGSRNGAANFVASSNQSLSSTDAGLPAGTATRSYGCWLKTATSAAMGVIGWGSSPGGTGAVAALFVDSSGNINARNVVDMLGPFIADGLWHFVVVVEDNTAADGVKRKMYVDGKLVVGATAIASITLAGANSFRIGAFPDGTIPMTGQVDGGFVHSVALTVQQIAALYAKGSLGLPPSPEDTGAHIEAFDATYVYADFSTLESQHQIDLAVAA